MSPNVLIGIGGTGARVIEAMINLCAAGYGPDNLAVFIIDPDEGNGNLTRTKTLISLYQRCQQRFNPTAATENKLFRTTLKTPGNLVWSIFKQKGTRLKDYIKLESMDPHLADFATVLFSDDELLTNLEKGFRGHPSIGSVVMANPDQNEDPWTILWDDITNKKQNEVRVFLAGSVFGGTGAAGVPTIGSRNLIKFNENATIGKDKSRVLLGGALVLPYFSIERDDDTEESMFVTHYDFPIATKAALHYYNEKQLGFDQLYLIGDSLNQKVGKFSVGSQSQENQPHYIELVTALAAFDFFAQPPVEGEPEKLYFIASRENEMITWDSLPVARKDEQIGPRQVELKSQLLTMTTFAYAVCTYGQEILDRDHGGIKEPWYREHFEFNEKNDKDNIKNPRWGENKTDLKNFTDYLGKYFLPWVTLMDDYSQKVSLISRERICEGEVRVGATPTLADREKKKENIGHFTKARNPEGKNFDVFLNHGLNAVNISREKTLSAANRFVNLFYEAAMKFCKQNYNLQ